MPTKTKRDQIIALKNENFTNVYISKSLNVARKTVYNVLKRFDERGTTEINTSPGRKKVFRPKK